MKKNFKVITINGVRGLFAAIFVVLGLIAGFIISPGWVCMQIWNKVFEDSLTLSSMNLFQGIMLWAIIALSLYALNNKRTLIGFGSYPTLSPDQIKDIMNRAKANELKNTLKKEIENINKEIKEDIKIDKSIEKPIEHSLEKEEVKEEIRS
ncbi:MAG: hypothetical protein IJY61_00200 [Candidatus Gastranaerophilales bacterium]|nr:hypothetical protein [Candidatus Gastranaerophilales bacterium]